MTGQHVIAAADQRLRMDQLLEAVRGVELPAGGRRLLWNIARWKEGTRDALALFEQMRRGAYPAIAGRHDPTCLGGDDCKCQSVDTPLTLEADNG